MTAQDAGRGLGRIVVAVLEIVCELLERQALRRVDAGTLTAEEIENLAAFLLTRVGSPGDVELKGGSPATGHAPAGGATP